MKPQNQIRKGRTAADMKVLLIYGSPRKGGSMDKVL